MPGAFSGLQLGGLPSSAQAVTEHEVPLNSSEPVAADILSKKSKGRVILSRLKAHRAGKVVIAIEGFEMRHTNAEIENLAKRLRSACGCGGTVAGRVVEVQGDQAARVRAFLESEGFHVSGVR
jgi:translation initiation factor 1